MDLIVHRSPSLTKKIPTDHPKSGLSQEAAQRERRDGTGPPELGAYILRILYVNHYEDKL